MLHLLQFSKLLWFSTEVVSNLFGLTVKLRQAVFMPLSVELC